MKSSGIRIIILVASILLIGLVSTQVFWVNKAYELEKKQFNHDVVASLKNVAQEILNHSQDSSQLYDPVKQVSENYFQVAINDTINPFYLESLLKREFKLQEINSNFEYGIYDCFSDSVVFRKAINFGENISQGKQTQAPQIKWDRDGHYFGVYFPKKRNAIFDQLWFWVISSFVLLAVILFFAYTISVILKQKRLSEIKNDFINNMTHELKTPISTISLSADVINNPDIVKHPERLLNYANIIRTENNRLKNHVERVLRLATLDDSIELNKAEVDIIQLIKDVSSSFELPLKEKNGKVEIIGAKSKMVFVDTFHVTNIISNLIDNAIKYCVENPIIKIGTQFDANSFSISISDNGIGIKKEHQSYIFDKFYRVPTGNIHNVKGFGLGLHYVRTIIIAHKGYISFKDNSPSGSIFIIKIPLK